MPRLDCVRRAQDGARRQEGARRHQEPIRRGEDALRRLLGAGQAWLRPKRRHKDNRLYRSHSFRFEKFEREEAENQVWLCDDYSTPVDLVRRVRPSPSLPSPLEHNIEILEAYCEPKDCKTYLEPGQAAAKLYTAPDTSNYSRPRPELSDDSLSDDDEEREVVKGCWSNDMPPRPKEEMPRRLYETAFDSVVVRTNESESERAANRSIQLSTERLSEPPPNERTPPVQRDRLLTERLVGEVKLGLTSLSIRGPRKRNKYSSSDTSSSGGSLESVASECSGSESRRSSSLSSHGSESPVRLFSHLNVLSPISDKSQEPEPSPTPSPPPALPPPRLEEAPASDSGISVESRNKDEEHVWDAREKSRRRRSERREDNASLTSTELDKSDTPKVRRRTKQGSPTDSSSDHMITTVSTQVDLEKLPFDMPKLRRKLRNTMSPENASQLLFEIPKHRRRPRQSSPRQERASSLGPPETESPPLDPSKLWRRPRQISPPVVPQPDIPDQNIDPELDKLPFDLPKLRRKMRLGSLPDPPPPPDIAVLAEVDKLPFDMPKLRRKLGLSPTEPPSCSFKGRSGLRLDLGSSERCQQPQQCCLVDPAVPLQQQAWYHGAITRLEAESILRLNKEGSFLVRNSESTKQDFSLSLKSSKGFMHMRIQESSEEPGKYILGQFSSPFSSIPEMIHYYTLHRLPIRGAEHIILSHPLIDRLL